MFLWVRNSGTAWVFVSGTVSHEIAVTLSARTEVSSEDLTGGKRAASGLIHTVMLGA